MAKGTRYAKCIQCGKDIRDNQEAELHPDYEKPTLVHSDCIAARKENNLITDFA